MIRRLNTLASPKSKAYKAPQSPGAQKAGKPRKPVVTEHVDRYKARSKSLNQSRIFLQPFEVSCALNNKGEILQKIRATYGLYSMHMAPFIDKTYARALRLKARKESEMDTANDKRMKKDARLVALATTDLYRKIIAMTPETDLDGLVLKPEGAQIRLAVTHSVAARFDKLRASLYRGHPDARKSVSVSKELIAGSRDQLLTVNIKKAADLPHVERFIYDLKMQEGKVTFNKDTDMPRAHTVARTETNYHEYKTPAQRGKQKIRLMVPTYMVGTLIGRGGKNIKKLREDSGAFISVKNDECRDTPALVQIVGLKKGQVTDAIAMIKNMLLDEWFSDKSTLEIEEIFRSAGISMESEALGDDLEDDDA